MNNKELNVAIYPKQNDSNKYIQITIDCIKKIGANIYGLDMVFKSFSCLSKTDAVIFNWFDLLGAKNRLYKFITRKIKLFILRFFGKKIIFVFHNIISHSECGSFLSKRIIKSICKKSHKIIILCSQSKQYLKNYLSEDEIEKKAFLIPHPNYIGAYSTDDFVITKYGDFSDEKINVLFIGLVRPYKNIELIIEIAKLYKDSPFYFIIAGRPFSESYKKQLEEKASGLTNVSLYFDFIQDNEIAGLINKSDVLLLPYDTTSSLNSGTVVLAFSNKKTVICPEIGTIMEYPSDVTFSYKYNDQNDHFERLKSIFCSFLSNDIMTVKKQLMLKGEEAYRLVNDKNSLDFISSRYKELFSQLK